MNETFTVWFHEAKGAPNSDAESAVAHRHKVVAHGIYLTDHDTLFVDESGAIVAKWPTSAISQVDWPTRALQSAGADRMKAIKERYKRAYAPWTAGEDDQLRHELAEGYPIASISAIHERQPGAIRSRLVKLGLEGN